MRSIDIVDWFLVSGVVYVGCGVVLTPSVSCGVKLIWMGFCLVEMAKNSVSLLVCIGDSAKTEIEDWFPCI